MGNQCCVGLVKPADDFEKSDLLQVDGAVRTVQMYASALVWINLLLVFAAQFIDLVPGACVGGPASGMSALPHSVFLISNTAALMYALYALGFDSTASTSRSGLNLAFSIFLMVVSIIVNVFHLIALIIEISTETSTFYQQSNAGFLIALTVGVAVFMLWQILIAARLYVYRQTLMRAVDLGWFPGVIIAMEQLREDAYKKPPSSSNQMASVNAKMGATTSAHLRSTPAPTASFSPTLVKGVKVHSQKQSYAVIDQMD